ncbi:MAG: hypothetical protein ABI181_00650 [Mycobacteriaceae bacterium]
MLSPTGPMPPQVYWRRRALAVAVVVVVVVLVVWIVSALVGGSAPEPTAQQSPLAAPATTSTAPPVTPAPASTTTEPGSTPAAASTASQTNPAAPTAAAVPSAATSGAPSVAPPISTAATPPPPTCVDPSVAVVAQVAQPSYPLGQQPVFRILISNVGKTPCARDLNAALQSVTVFTADGSTRLWSSNDCYPGKTTDVPTLAPGKVTTFSVKWAGTTSEPTCTADRTPVPAGQYRVVAALGKLVSAPVPFTLT